MWCSSGLSRSVLDVSDQYYVAGDSVLVSFCATFALLPSLVLAAQSCPYGMEAFMYALFSSTNHVGFNVARRYSFSCWLLNYSLYFVCVFVRVCVVAWAHVMDTTLLSCFKLKRLAAVCYFDICIVQCFDDANSGHHFGSLRPPMVDDAGVFRSLVGALAHAALASS